MLDLGSQLQFIVCQQGPDGAPSIVGACRRMADAECVVATLRARHDGIRYWLEEDDGEQPGSLPHLLAAPSLDVICRVAAPPVRLSVNPPWTREPPTADEPESLRFTRPRSVSEGAADFVISGLELDRGVPFDAYAEHFWSHRRFGSRKYVSEDVAKEQFSGRPARGYDWATGVSEIFGWLIHVAPRRLVWAACEVEVPHAAHGTDDARALSQRLLGCVEFLDHPS